MPSSGIGAATGVLAVGAPGAADALVVGRAAWAAVVSVLRPITKPTASSPTTSATAAAPTTTLRGRRLLGAGSRASAAGGGEKSSRRRANGAAADRRAVPCASGLVSGQAYAGYSATRKASGLRSPSEMPARSLAASAKSRQVPNRSAALLASARENTASRRASSGRWSLSRGDAGVECRRRTGQHMKGGGRQRVLVGPPIDVGPAVRARRAADLPGLPGYPEIGQQNPLFALPAAWQQDVGGFDIAMQQSALVRVVKGAGDGGHDGKHLARR